MKNTTYGYQLNPQEFLDRATKILLQDKQRLGKSNYPVFKSPVSQGMSPMTARADDLRMEGMSRSAPYTAQMEQVLGRTNTGFSPQATGAAVQSLQQRQQEFANQKITPALQRQFGQAYAPYHPELSRYIGKDIQLAGGEYGEKLGEIGAASGNLDSTRNDQLTKSLQALRGQEEGKRNLLTQGLTKYGEEQQGYQNYGADIYRRAFNKEQGQPYEKMGMLEKSLAPLSGALGDNNIHPDVLKMKMDEAAKAMRVYGIDTSKPVDQWEQSRVASPTYKGELVSPLPPEMKAAYSTMGNLSSNYADKHTGQRNMLLNKLMGDESPSSRVLGEVPQAVQGRTALLENAAQEALNKDIEGVNAQFIRAGQYGSPAHLRAITERSQGLNRATLQERQKLSEGALKSNLSTEHGSQIADLEKLNQYGTEGYKEYLDTLANVGDMHKVGMGKLKSRQRENEDMYQNFQNEALWEMPYMRSQARHAALGEIFPQWTKEGRGLEDIIAMNTTYKQLEPRLNEAERRNKMFEEENFGLRGQLTTQQDAHRHAQEQLRREQAAATQADQERRAAAQAEQQRVATLQAQSAVPQNARSSISAGELKKIQRQQYLRDNYPNFPGILSRYAPYLQNRINALPSGSEDSAIDTIMTQLQNKDIHRAEGWGVDYFPWNEEALTAMRKKG